jgi:hypothetical protein
MTRKGRILACIAMASAICICGVAQTSQQKTARTVLLDVIRKSWNVERNETLVYVRVYSDGFAEAHLTREVDFRNIVLRNKQISASELEDARKLLIDPATGVLAKRYVRYWGNKDFGYEYRVSNLASEKKQVIELENFQPFAARKQNKPYPPQLEKLGCMIWKIRTEVTGEPLEKDWLRGCADLGY